MVLNEEKNIRWPTYIAKEPFHTVDLLNKQYAFKLIDFNVC